MATTRIRPSKTRRLQVVGLGLVVLACAWLIYARWDPLQARARSALVDMRDGNVRNLVDLETSEERSEGVSEAQLKSIYEISVRPRLGLIKETGSIESEPADDMQGSGIASCEVRLVNGVGTKLGYQVFVSEDGPKARVAANLINAGWQLEYMAQPGYVHRNGDLLRAALAGLQQDQAKLEAAGISGLYLGPDKGFKTWSEYALDLQSRIARF